MKHIIIPTPRHAVCLLALLMLSLPNLLLAQETESSDTLDNFFNSERPTWTSSPETASDAYFEGEQSSWFEETPRGTGRDVANPLSLQPDREQAYLGNPNSQPGILGRMFVRTAFDWAWLAPGDADDGLGVTDVTLSTSIAMPWSTKESAWIITPGFGFHFWESPAQLQLPSTLYDAYLDFSWRAQFGDRLSLNVGVAPGVYSDFETWDGDAIRITGRAFGTIALNQRWTLLLGVVYLDRPSFPVIPAVGVIWRPTPDWLLELTAPKPRIAYRLIPAGPKRGLWAYTAGQIGGGAWLIEVPNGRAAELEYNDFQILAGLEWVGNGRFRMQFETGYVLGRELELQGQPDNFDLDDTFVLRGSLVF